jgi:hypothetical protein
MIFFSITLKYFLDPVPASDPDHALIMTKSVKKRFYNETTQILPYNLSMNEQNQVRCNLTDCLHKKRYVSGADPQRP